MEDKDGKQWQQVSHSDPCPYNLRASDLLYSFIKTRKYFKGIGAGQNWYKRVLSGITGSDFAPLIASVYKVRTRFFYNT